MKFTGNQLKKLWLEFYESKGHVIIPSASVIPENDNSVLFTTAGMQPLVPYLLGQKHPEGKRLCDIQKCIRTGDIDDVGDNTHLTFFEMMGNWSLGDYFKEKKIPWSFEFLTSKKYLGLNIDQLAVTVFEGNEYAPRDEESARIWEECGMPKDRIYFLPKEDNWWEINRGPCGPDSEMYLDTGKPKCSEHCSPACNCGKFVELGNDVYMQYEKIDENKYIPAKQKNVDCGFGLERNLIVLNGVKSVYMTDVFEGSLKKIEELSGKKYNDNGDVWTRSFRIIADHVRTATVILGDVNGITPSNTDAGYVLRRLIRKAVRHSRLLGVAEGSLGQIADIYIDYFKDFYPEFVENREKILTELQKEEDKFLKTLNQGVKEFEKVINNIEKHKEFAKAKGEVVENVINGKQAFRLYETFGFPLEITREMAEEKGYAVDEKGFEEAYKAHQELARASSSGHFKGGLADNDEDTILLHTACHLLQAGLRHYLGNEVYQRGSNITSERLRFDFSYGKPMTAEEKQKVEDWVNDAIKRAIPVTCEEMSVEEAKKSGALGIFDSKYGNRVKVYTIGDVSKEICGGPHAQNTSQLISFKIVKEESSSAGVRRIKAVIKK